MANTERDMNFYPGRKVMFLKIKNKFRFVSIFLLLASLVTIVSSASADEWGEVQFDFTVASYDCSATDELATWSPINATGDLVVNPGDEVTVTANPQFIDGWTDCSDYSLDATGYVTSDIELPIGWTGTVECDNEEPRCYADPAEETIDAYFTVPGDASFNDYLAILYLTWVMP
jgi:hypothetical protein